MLVLSRRSGEAIRIGEATVRIIRRRGATFKVEIDAPPTVKILRAELVARTVTGDRQPVTGCRRPATEDAA